MFAVGVMLINQQKEVQSLSESLARLEVEKLLIGVLADGKVCTKLLASKTFSSNTLNWQPSLALTGLPANELSGASNILSVNSLASSLSSSLKIDTIDFVDILNNNATPASNSWRASLVVSFTGSVRALKPIKIQTILMTDSDPVTKTVINCSSVANLPTPTWVFSSGIQWNSSPNGGAFISGTAPHPPGIQPSGDAQGDFYYAFAPDCPPGQKVLSCAFRQTTLVGAELGILTTYSLSNSPIWPYPHSVSARLLYDDLDTESRPRCKLLLRNIYPARYYPAILCQ
ncbi:MAG: hypothetical protein JNL11_09465 [Bdellovibrionaceae bacterium]|nr:hypothetical protein [Pseudobdellovibrionaceae bacterium]